MRGVQLARCAGVYNETYFQGLDLALASAARHDVHVIITMGNNWCARAGSPDALTLDSRSHEADSLGCCWQGHGRLQEHSAPWALRGMP